MIPFLRSLKKFLHICQVVISYPTTDVFRQAFLQPKEAFAVTALGNGFYFAKKLLLTLLVHSNSTSTFWQSVETIPEKLLARQCAHHCLFLVDFQEQFLLNIIGNTISHAFSSAKALNEYYTVVSIADKWMSSAFEFLVEFIQYDVTQYWTQRSALWDSFCRFLVLVSHHYSCIQVFMDERDYSSVNT